MSVIDTAISFATSLFGMIIIITVVGGGGLMFYLYKYGDAFSKGTVILFRPRDKRAEFIPIEKEEEFIIKCRQKNGILRRYVKGGNGWIIKRKNYFLGVEGSGYTAIIGNAEQKSLPMTEVLKLVWGEEFYNKVPSSRKNQLTESQWILNVAPNKIDVDLSGLPRLSSEDLDDKDDTIVLEKLAKSVRDNKAKVDLLLLGLSAGCGAGITLLAVAMKWVKF